MPGLVENVRLLLWRNTLLLQRAKKDTFFTLFSPLMLVGLVAFLVLVIPQQSYESIPDPETLSLTNTLGLALQGGSLVYSPNSSDVEEVMERIRQKYPSEKVSVLGFSSEDDLNNYYAQHNGTDENDPENVWAALIFDGLATNKSFNPEIVYKIKVNGTDVPSTDDDNNLVSGHYEKVANGTSDYVKSGFLSLQLEINSQIISFRLREVEPTTDFKMEVDFQYFPVPGFTLSNLDLFGTQLPLLFQFAFQIVFNKMFVYMVREKETRTREGMKMMGISSDAISLGWYLTYAVFVLLITTAITIVLAVTGLFPKTSLLVLFSSFFLSFLTTLMLALMAQPFFNETLTASSGGQLGLLFLWLPYLALSKASGPVKAAVSLLPPVAFANVLDAIRDAEVTGTGIGTGGNFRGGPSTALPWSSCMLIMLFDLGLYAFLAFYFDRVVPSKHGTARLPCFCLPCTARGGRSGGVGRGAPPHSQRLLSEVSAAGGGGGSGGVGDGRGAAVDAEPVAAELGEPVLSLRGLTKVFEGKGDKRVVAVDGLNLDLYKGQILALLGHNGGGKTTTIGMLTGMVAMTAGEVMFRGKELSQNMAAFRKELGVCPQHDILFEALTVKEHLVFYAKAKGLAADRIEAEINDKVQELGLQDKLTSQAWMLSGGQKRKLSLAIALMGDSSVIFCDEPTSGMDPLTRRSVWQILQRYKKGRVIVLTTHYMDEADLLGDRIAVLSKGKVRCVGSSLFLKSRFGLGYHLDVGVLVNYPPSMPSAPPAPEKEDDGVGAVVRLVQGCVPSAKRVQGTSGQAGGGGQRGGQLRVDVSFLLPLKESPKFAELFQQLEEQGRSAGVDTYGCSMTTLEEVFLSLAHEASEPSEASQGSAAQEEKAKVPARHRVGAMALDMPMVGQSGGREEMAISQVVDTKAFQISLGRQIRALVRKRWYLLSRSKMGLFYMYVMPLIYMLMGVLIGSPGAETGRVSPPAMAVTMAPYDTPCFLASANQTMLPQLERLTAGFLQPEPVAEAAQPEALDRFIFGQAGQQDSFTGLFAYNLPSSWRAPQLSVKTLLLTNSSGVHSQPALLAAFTNAVLGQISPPADGFPDAATFSVTATNSPFAYEAKNSGISSGVLTVAIFVGLAFGFVPMPPALSVVKEKESGAKHLQKVMGTRACAFWAANYITDLGGYSLVCVVACVVMSQVGTFAGPTFAVLPMLLMLHGAAGLSVGYASSFAFQKFATAQSTLPGVAMLLGIISAVLAFYFCYATSSLNLTRLALLFSPTGTLIFSLFRLAQASEIYSQCGGLPECPVSSLSDLLGVANSADAPPQFGDKLLIFAMQTLVLALLVSRLERSGRGPCGGALRSCCGGKRAGRVEQLGGLMAGETPDADVDQEALRVQQRWGQDENVLLEAKGLCKVFEKSSGFGENVVNRRHVAVDNLSFVVGKSQCFGLLGPNGAGKSTAMKLLTGDETPTAGDALVSSGKCSITSPTGRDKIYRSLGFCPQIDPLLATMTGSEHMVMYARLKGVPEESIRPLVEHMMRELMLSPHKDKQVQKYSGGSKRKLALGLAMMACPEVQLLDEPSSGMDPEARQNMWGVIKRNLPGRSILLTTHSMEEADALCGRIAIMVNGVLKCIGSSQYLRAKHGSGYLLDLRLFSGEPSAVEAAKRFVSELWGQQVGEAAAEEHKEDRVVPAAEGGGEGGFSATGLVMNECFGGSLRYKVAAELVKRVTLSKAFRMLQEEVEAGRIKDYNLSQTTLDQVFVAHAKLQVPEEEAENYYQPMSQASSNLL